MVGPNIQTPRPTDWIALWVHNERVVRVEAGGENIPRTAGLLQNPITLTAPDGRYITVDPADKSLTVRTPETEVAGLAEGNPTPLIAAALLVPVAAAVVIASPVDEAVVVRTVGKYIVAEQINDIDDLPLVTDGGTEGDRPPGYDALREQGVPEATIEDWHEKGYDLRQMSDALETYKGLREDASSRTNGCRG